MFVTRATLSLSYTYEAYWYLNFSRIELERLTAKLRREICMCNAIVYQYYCSV